MFMKLQFPERIYKGSNTGTDIVKIQEAFLFKMGNNRDALSYYKISHKPFGPHDKVMPREGFYLIDTIRLQDRLLHDLADINLVRISEGLWCRIR